MKILHTADWHLGDRLGRIDRTQDLRRAVERIAGYCEQEAVDVLLVAGDLFSELARPDGLRDAVRHLQQTFEPFLHQGGTILTLTGNHDNENFCQTLRAAMGLAAPASGKPGERVAPGRLYLATGPSLLRLADRAAEFEVQFLLMPYPTPARYLTEEPAQRYGSGEEKNRQLLTAFTARLGELRSHPRLDPGLPAVLAAHIQVEGGQVSPLFRITEEEDVVLPDADLPAGFAYVALGHIHKPQCLGGHAHVRYSGSIERMDLGEAGDQKSVVILEVGPDGRRGEPTLRPLDATPVYEVNVFNPAEQLPTLWELYPDHEEALVKLHFTYTAGKDNLEEILRQLEATFPRWYSRDWKEAGELGPSLTTETPARTKTFRDTVLDYLKAELINHPDEDRDAVVARTEALLHEVQE